MGGLAKLLSDSWTSSRGVLGALGEVLGVMLGPKMAAKVETIDKSVAKRQKVPQAFLMDFVSKISSPGDHKSQYLSLGILGSNAYRRLQHRHRNLLVLGGNMAPCWPSKSRKIAFREASGRGPGGVLGGFWLVVGLLGSSRRFEGVLGRF